VKLYTETPYIMSHITYYTKAICTKVAGKIILRLSEDSPI